MRRYIRLFPVLCNSCTWSGKFWQLIHDWKYRSEVVNKRRLRIATPIDCCPNCNSTNIVIVGGSKVNG